MEYLQDGIQDVSFKFLCGSAFEIMYTVSAAAAVGLLFFCIYRYVIYPAFFSPLSKIPNANITASISPLWIQWIRFKGTENRTLYAKHEKLGQIVRLGPSELSVNCVDGGIRKIYGFEKTDWYNLFPNYGYGSPSQLQGETCAE